MQAQLKTAQEENKVLKNQVVNTEASINNSTKFIKDQNEYRKCTYMKKKMNGGGRSGAASFFQKKLSPARSAANKNRNGK